MKKLVLSIYFVLLATVCYSDVNDAPHNTTNDIACSECHSYSLWWQFSPSSNNLIQSHDQTVNIVCLRCHGPESLLAQKTHSSEAMGTTTAEWNWSRNCVDCHDPHFQAQLDWLKVDASLADQLYLVKGTIDVGTIDAPTINYNQAENTTLLSYNSANSTKTNWLDPLGWNAKTEIDRGLILVVSVENQDNSFEINEATGEPIRPGMADGNGTITVQGHVSSDMEGANFGLVYGQLIRNEVNKLPVKFFSPEDPNYSFVDNSGQGTEGLCQVCHDASKTKFYNPEANGHYSRPCTGCHSHEIGFAHGSSDGGSGQNCSTADCHDSGKHPSHLDSNIDCIVCHDLENMRDLDGTTILFKDGKAIAETEICITCHNDGVSTPADPTLPALKTGWPHDDQVVYDLGCDGCHGNPPAYPDGMPKDNKHVEHVTNGGITCDKCHYGTTIDGITTLSDGLHHNNTYDVSAAPGVDFEYFIAVGGWNCSNVSCHITIHDFAHVTNSSCLRCHFDNIVEEHVDSRGFSCAICHDNTIRSVVDTIAAGSADTPVNCESCHHAEDTPTNGIGKFQDAHHDTIYATSGNCTTCHVVGAGTRGAAQMPCLKCHGSGAIADPKRDGIDAHKDGPALTKVYDQRVCFSCHLADGAGYVAGVTPIVTPLHAEPTDYGYHYFDEFYTNRSDFDIPTLAFPGKDNINRLFPYMRAYGSSTPTSLGSTDFKFDPVEYNFPEDSYTLVPNTTDGTIYWVPSYVKGGARGKISGSAKLRVTIEPLEAITAGAEWREDGTAWETNGATKVSLSPRQHLIEGKYISGWATPPAIPVSIPDDNSTVDTTIKYEPCPADGTLTLTRTSGADQHSITWPTEFQQEDFSVSGNTPSWDVEWFLDTDGATGFTVVSLSATTARVEKNGESTAGTYNFTLKAVGSSCPGNEESISFNVTILDTGTGSPTLPPYYGQISDSIIDTTPLGITATQPALFHLAGDLYGVAYPEASLSNTNMFIKTFTVAANGTISDFIGTFSDTTVLGNYRMDAIRLSDTTMAVVHYDSHNTISLHTYSITSSGLTIAPVSNTVIESAALGSQPLTIKHITGNYYAILHSGKSIITVEIDPGGSITNPLVGSWYDIYSGIGNNIEHVSGNVYAVLTLKDNKSQLMTFTISSNGVINPSGLDFFDYQGSGSSSHKGTIRKISSNSDIFALAHNTLRYGTLITVKIDTTGLITQEVINSHLIDGLDSANFDIIPIIDNVIAVHYGKTPTGGYYSVNNTNGVIQTFGISSQGKIDPAGIDYFSVSDAQYFDMMHAVGDYYVFANSIFDGVKTVRINTESPQSLVASLGATDGINCGETSFEVSVEPGDHTGPYFCDFSWGDGTIDDTNVQCGAGFTTTHTFAGTAATSEVTWTVRNNDGYLLHPEFKTISLSINRDIDGDGLCGADLCPNDPDNDEDGDGNCGTQYAYISSEDNKVSLIRVSDGYFKGTFDTGTGGHGIAVSPDNSKVYLTDHYDTFTSVFNTTLKTFSNVTTGYGGSAIAVSPNGAYLYVAYVDYDNKGIGVFRTSDMSLVKTIPLGGFTTARKIAASLDSARVYAATDESTLAVIRTSDLAVIDNIQMVGNGGGIAVSPDSKYVYTTTTSTSGIGTVSIMQVADNSVETVTVGNGPRGLAPSPDGSYLYVANSLGNSVSAIRLSDKVVTTIDSIVDPFGISVSPDGSKVYVVSPSHDMVYIINSATMTVSTTIPVTIGGYLSDKGRFISATDPFIPAPDISVTDPDRPYDNNGLDLGTIYQGNQSSQKTVTVTNDGNTDLIIGTLSQDNPLGTKFSLINDNCSAQTLEPDDSCTFGIIFFPPVAGVTATYSDSIYIPSNDPDENPTAVTVTGTGYVQDTCVGGSLTNTPFANSGETGIDGLTPLTAFSICTLAQLNEVRTQLDKHYIMQSDIDAADTATGSATQPWNTTSGWLPIGESTSGFTGEFNGNGHTISNLFINRPTTDYIGLFGYINTGSVTLKNIGLINVNITGGIRTGSLAGIAQYATVTNSYATGSLSGQQYVGGLIGNAAWATVSNSHSDATITATSNHVGGLIGNAIYANIDSSHATGIVNGNSYNVGGLLGRADLANVSNSYATGDVIGTNSSNGGLSGSSPNATYSNCYATGNITGNELTAGFIGNANGTIISNSFSTGNVTGTSTTNYVGVLIGYGTLSSNSDLYYNSGATVINLDIGGAIFDNSTFATGNDLLSLKDTATPNPVYNTWDFTTIWQENPGEFPTLR